MKIAVALLEIDKEPRLCCVGCTSVLHKEGMLRVVKERELFISNECDGGSMIVIYAIADGYTLETCRRFIRHRHQGPPFGE